ncbi:hypothetical protein GJ496_008844 [Pomphorhynchus laevis]|nr:hypothetical protein GJ496_008844 [Pomphorhynchus laevis]
MYFNFQLDPKKNKNEEDFTKEVSYHDKIDMPSGIINYDSNIHQFTINPTTSLSINDQTFNILDDTAITAPITESNNAIVGTDIVNNVYEGGCALWEASIDLTKHLMDHVSDFACSNILELGCGHGLPGITMIRLLPQCRVDFQDYNKDVLNNVTIANVLRNASEDGLKRCRFIYGPWNSMKHILVAHYYDVIINAETIYNPNSYSDLLDVFDHALSVEGVVILAAKSLYFGVGGSIKLFMEAIRRSDIWTVQTVKTIKESDSLSRQIIELRRKVNR